MVGKLLNIRPNEWARLLFLCGMLFIYVVGWTWAASITEAAFLGEDQLGIQALPWLCMTRAVVFVPLVALYSAFADRITNTKLLILIVMIVVVGILMSISFLAFDMERATYTLLFLIFFILDEIFATHWYTYINDFFDTRSAKRIIPVLTSSAIVASVVGGWTMPLLSHLFSPVVIVLIWLATLVLVAITAWLAPYLVTNPTTTSTETSVLEETAGSHLQNIREGYHYVIQSPFLRWMSFSTLFVIMLLVFLEYQTSKIMLEQLKTVENIASFTGRVVGVGNMIMFPLQLFLLNRIIGRIGIGNANLIFPVGNLAFSGALIAAPSIPTVAVSYFSRTNFFSSVGYLTDGLLYNAVPLRVKARARAFIGGLVAPFGLFLGSVLLVLSPHVPAPWLLPVLIGFAASAHVISTIVIRKRYTQALITMLEEEDFSFLMARETTRLPVSDPATLNSLKKKLNESTSDEFTIFIAKLISQVGGSNAVPILGEAARNATSPLVRSAILDILNAEDVRDEAVAQLYQDFLSDEHALVRQSALSALADIYEPTSKTYLDVAQRMVSDPDIDVRTQALTPMVQATGTPYYEVAYRALEEMLTDEDTHRRARGVHVLGQVGTNAFLRQLTDALSDPADEVRLEAALALESALTFETWSTDPLPPDIIKLLVERISLQVKDPVERVRKTSLIVLGRLDSAHSFEVFLHALKDPARDIRTTAVDILVDVGRTWSRTLEALQQQGAAAPTPENKKKLVAHQSLTSLGRIIFITFQSYLETQNPQMRRMAALVLSRIDPEQYRSFVTTCVYDNLQTIYILHGRIAALQPLASHASVAMLISALHEYIHQLLEEIFSLLAAISNPEMLQIITEALNNAAAHIRANAIEALEAITTPQIAQLIEPLYDSELSTERIMEIGKETWAIDRMQPGEVIQQLASNPYSPWMRAMMTFALGEIGAAQKTAEPAKQQPEPAPEPVPEPDRRSRRLRGRDLFAALEANVTNDTTSSQPTRRNENQQPASQNGLSLAQIEEMIQRSLADTDEDVRVAAQSARRVMAGRPIIDTTQEEKLVLSTIERIIFLKGVPFFQGMTVEQLKVLATVCEEKFFEKDARIVTQGDHGGTLYMIINGRVGIEQERRKGSFARLSTLDAHSYFGEANLFDNSPHEASAIAVQDTLTLQLHREPLIALARQHPDLSLELINVLSQRLREANARVADLTRTRPRELHKLFDQFE